MNLGASTQPLSGLAVGAWTHMKLDLADMSFGTTALTGKTAFDNVVCDIK